MRCAGACALAAPRARRGARGGRVLAAGARGRARPPARAPRRRARPRGATPPATSTARCRAAIARWSCRASSSPSTTGAARTTRSCRRSPTGRWRCASSSPSPTCARSTCSGPPTRSSASSAPCRASSAAAGPAWASARCSRAPTTTARAAARSPASSAAGVLRRARPGPTAPTGRSRTVPGAAGTLEPAGAPAAGPPLGPAAPAGMVRVLPRAGATVVDGSAPAIADLAAFGALRTDRALRYAGDLDAAALREQAARGASFVISDSNRRRAFVAARLRGNTGWTLPADEQLSEDAAQLDPFPARGTDAQTVARIGGIASARADFSPGFAQFPEHRPFAALDGDTLDRMAGRPRARHRPPPPRRRPSRRRATSTTSTSCPTATARAGSTAWRSTGASSPCGDGWNRLPVGLRGVRSLSVRIAHVVQPEGGEGGAGGIRELRIPGVRATRGAAPAGARRARAARRRPAPRRRSPTSSIAPPATTRTARASSPARARAGWCATSRTASAAGRGPSPRPRRARGAPTRGPASRPRRPTTSSTRGSAPTRRATLRRLLALRGPAGATAPRRPSTAIRGAAWIAGWIGSRGAWLQWRDAGAADDPHACASSARRVRVRFPTRVRVIADGRPTAPLAVAADGAVALPAPLRARTVRIEVLDAALPARARPAPPRQRRAVGVGEVTRRRRPARRRQPRRRRCACPAPRARRSRLGRRARCACAWPPPPAAIDAGRPLYVVALRARGRAARRAADRPCRPGAVAPGPRAAHLGGARRARRSPAAAGCSTPAATGAARATASASPSTGRAGSCSASPTTRGWRARCDGRSLGRPVADAGLRQRLAESSAAAATCPSPSRPTARCSPPTRSRSSPASPCWRCSSLRRPRAGPASLAPLPDVPAPRAGRCAARSRPASPPGSCSASSSRCAPAPSSGPLTFLVLWRGVSARALALAAGVVLLVGLPVLHLAVGLPDEGFDTNYAAERIAEHWLAVGAVWRARRAPCGARSVVASGSVRPRPAQQPRHDQRLDHEVAREPRQLARAGARRCPRGPRRRARSRASDPSRPR